MIAALAVRPAARRTRGVWLALGTAAIAAACTAGILAWQATGDAPASEAERRLALVEATPTERPPARVVADVPPADQRSPRRSAAPTPSRVTQTEYERIYRRATDRLDFGDGGACVQLLDAARPPATMVEHAGVLRAKCIMKTGDCARGRVLLESTARAHHWDAARTAKMLEHADLTYCPLEAGPRTQWTERARYRLQIASSTGRSCASILAFIAHHGLELPDRREALMLEAACHANVGDCKAARAAQRKAFTFGIGDPARAAELAQVADDTFAATHRQRCP
jgi:hypothetical protein